ncbi:MAG: alkaline phosphatase family protein [bacterium]|nr:alkaline phosphatase family protein [bacterium]
MRPPQIPDYSGGSLVNLAAELENRLIGTSPSVPLHPDLSRLIPHGQTYVLLLVDGLGSRQLDHPAAAPLASARAADIDAPFPTTTTVSWATIATGLPPSQHGLLGYQLYLPETEGVVYTIQWTRGWGEAVPLDHAGFLPTPNLWERLTSAGVEPITVQPGNFAGTHLSKVLYRGCRFEPVFSFDEAAIATNQLAAVPNRLIVTYLPNVDVAAHIHGQRSPQYASSLRSVADLWTQIERGLPDGAVLLGTADHGHVDYPKEAADRIERSDEATHVFYGDSRVMFVRGEGADLAEYLPATWIPVEEATEWWGPGPRHPRFDERAPDGLLFADDGRILMHKFSDDRMIGHHGGLSDAERRIPLLIGRHGS